jgi:ribosomal protein S12 methylthiotransferase accessory factor
MEEQRKDLLPNDTIKKIQNILILNGINTEVINHKNFEDKWFSNSVKLVNLDNLSTNGKGVKSEYALASAYAELIERIQSGFLLDNSFLNKKDFSDKSSKDINSLIDIYYRYFSHRISKKHDELITLLNNNIGFEKICDYYDFRNKKIVKLPDSFVAALCGSNGLASGNTKEEAFVQGTCEVFERYVNKIIHMESYESEDFPTIDEKYYRETYAYNLIKVIEKKGYKVIVKDCTLNGLLPVISVVILNLSKTKYYFSIGSDVNFDICLQRCITEMFQGKDIALDFRFHMHNFGDDNEGFWDLKNRDEEFAKTLRNGSGKLPRRFFTEYRKEYSNTTIEPFVYERINNTEAVMVIKSLLMKLDINVYVKDHSYLGFDTLRIYIPEMSETTICGENGILELYINYIKFRESYFNNDLDGLNVAFTSLCNSAIFSNEYILSSLLSINKKRNRNENCILDKDVHYLMSMVNLYLGHYNRAIFYLNKYHKISNISAREAYLQNMSLEAVFNSVPKEKFMGHISVISTPAEEAYLLTQYDMFSDIKSKGIEFFKCIDCVNCTISELCNYASWKKIVDNLKEKKNHYEVSYSYDDSLYKILSL